MDVSILTVTWNSGQFIKNQIESVQNREDKILIEQLIADNASTDKTESIIKNNFPEIYFQKLDKNLGFAAANNNLAKKATGKYLLLLNPDMEVIPGAITKLFEYAEKNPSSGIVSGLLLDSSGNINSNTLPRRFPTIFDQLVIVLKLHKLFPNLLKKYLCRDKDFSKIQNVDSVQGSFMLIRRSVLDNFNDKLFDEKYYIWFEDVDLCRRVRQNGLNVTFLPYPVAKDFAGRSFKMQNIMWKQYNFVRSMIKYFIKWGIKAN